MNNWILYEFSWELYIFYDRFDHDLIEDCKNFEFRHCHISKYWIGNKVIYKNWNGSIKIKIMTKLQSIPFIKWEDWIWLKNLIISWKKSQNSQN